MTATNAAHQMVLEARKVLELLGSPAADVLAVRLGEHLPNQGRELRVMPVGGRIAVGEIEVRRFTTDLWELRDPNRFGCVMVGRTDPSDDYRTGAWKVVQFGDNPPALLDETRHPEAALWIALDALSVDPSA